MLYGLNNTVGNFRTYRGDADEMLGSVPGERSLKDSYIRSANATLNSAVSRPRFKS